MLIFNLILLLVVIVFVGFILFMLIEIVSDFRFGNWTNRVWTQFRFRTIRYRVEVRYYRLRYKVERAYRTIKNKTINRWGNSAKGTTMKKKVIDLQLTKVGMDTVLTIKVAPEIEDFFRRASLQETRHADDRGNRSEGNIGTSYNWTDADGRGLKYYIKNEQLSNKVSQYANIVDSFGSGLIKNNCPNLALLRIVGLSEGDGVTIKTGDLLGYEEMKQYLTQLGEWTKAFYENHLQSRELSGSVTFEV